MRCAVFLLLCLLALGQPIMAAPLTPGDFARGWALPVTEGNGVYGLDLPLAVYEQAVRRDLGDLRVFNGAGEIVPHAVRSVATETRQTRQPVPFFPLADDRPAQATDLSLRVVRQADGTVITVDTGARTTPQPAASYLLDTTRLDPRPSELELQWSHPDGLLTVSLMQSSDLAHWSPLVGRVVLADLTYNGGKVVARRILLPGKTLPYLRLDCIDCRKPMEVQEVIALSGTPVTAEQWHWLQLQGTLAKEEKGAQVIDYRLEANVTVTALQLGFPAANSLVRAVIEARSQASAPWRQVARADFYRLDLQGASLANPLVPCPPTAAREWRLRVIADGAGLEGDTRLPRLELGWQRDELLFLGRGTGPYTLAVGSAKAAAAETAPNTLVLAALRDAKAEPHIQRVTPGPLLTLGGDQALRPGLPPVSWQKVLLWAVLIAGVALLALMTRTILREMRGKTD